jgi:uncharacterized Zn-binding protein involved in type VI secretion
VQHSLKLVKRVGQPAAKQGDKIVAQDIHIVMVPSPTGLVPTPTPLPFNGIIDGNLSSDVFIEGKPAAVVGSTATNTPPHTPVGGVSFQVPPKNKGTILVGSMGVFINGKPAARNGDTALTCNDPVDLPVGKVVAVGQVFIGDMGVPIPKPPAPEKEEEKRLEKPRVEDYRLLTRPRIEVEG